MSNIRYKRGRDFEYEILNKLKSQGFYGIRSAGSHSPVDLFIWDREGTVCLIQCKSSMTNVININRLICEDSVQKLAAMPDKFGKVLLIKQPRHVSVERSIRNIQLVYDGTSWKIRNIFDI